MFQIPFLQLECNNWDVKKQKLLEIPLWSPPKWDLNYPNTIVPEEKIKSPFFLNLRLN